MATYNTKNGTQTEASMAAQLQNAGWTPSPGDSVQAAYARTTGGDVTAASAPQSSGGAPGAPRSSAAPGSPDLSGYVAAMQASSGLSIKQLEENKRQFDATLAQQQLMWQQQGLPQLAIAQRTAELEQQKFAQLQSAAVFSQNLSTAQLALDDRIKSGQLSVQQAQQELANRIQSGQLAVQQDQQALARQIQTGQLALAQKTQADTNAIQQGQLGVSQGQLGLDTLKTGASLSGPENWIQAANFSRGVAGNSQLPSFITQLLNGQRTAVLGGPQPGAQQSAPLTLGGMATSMGATPGVSATPTAVTQPAVPLVDPNADAAARAKAYTSQAASPTAAPAGFFTNIAGNQQVYTPTAEGAAAAGTSGPAATAGMDATHMGAFYAAALKNANHGTQTPGVAPDSTVSPQATPDDVSRMFSMSTPAAGQTAQPASAQSALAKLYAGGGQALGPQALEGLTPTETKMMQGGGAALGADVSGFQSQYDRSRIGQKTAMPTVAGAG